MAEQNERNFQFRLRSSHRAPEYQTSNLVVEFLADSGLWEPQQLSITMPGFRLYLISLLLCQHFYLVPMPMRGRSPCSRWMQTLR